MEQSSADGLHTDYEHTMTKFLIVSLSQIFFWDLDVKD